MSHNDFQVDKIVKEQVCFILPWSRVLLYPKRVIILRHRLFCVAERRPLLTEEFYLSVGKETRFQTRKPGDLFYPIEDCNHLSKGNSLLHDTFTNWLWLSWRSVWNISFLTIRGVFDKWWGTRLVRYPTKPSYVYPFKEWEQTSRTYYINCFGEKRYLGHIRKKQK